MKVLRHADVAKLYPRERDRERFQDEVDTEIEELKKAVRRRPEDDDTMPAPSAPDDTDRASSAPRHAGTHLG